MALCCCLNVHMNYSERKQGTTTCIRVELRLNGSQQYVDFTVVSGSKEENSLFAA